MKLIHQFSLSIFLLCAFATAHAQSWQTQPSMKLKRSEATALDYQGQLYVFNGFSQGLQVGTSVEKYNPNSKQWNIETNTSVAIGTGVTHAHGVVVGGEAWIIGGRIGAHPGKVSDKVWIYNFQSKTFRTGPKLPKPMAGGGAALVNNKIYSFGGIDAQAKCDVNFHYVYDLGKPSAGWKNITASAGMPSARNHFSTVVVNNKIYAIGGQHGHDGCPGIKGGNVPLVHTFNPQNNKWSRLADLPSKDSHNEPGTFVHNGFIYTVGGALAGKKVLRYNPGQNKWQSVATLPEPLLAPVARIYNGTLVVAGGGAPITAKSQTLVRSISLAKFSDNASGNQAVNSSANTNSNTSSSSANNSASTSTSNSANNSSSSSSNSSSNSNSSSTVASNNANANNATSSSSTTNTPKVEPVVVVPLAPAHVAKNNMVVIEAENYQAKTSAGNHQWSVDNKPNASGNASLVASPNIGALRSKANDSPKLSYNVSFAEAGTYYVWIRGWGDRNSNGEGKNDSIHAGLNNKLSSNADKIDGFPAGWNWSNSTRDGSPASINVPSAGTHEFNLWMREDGFSFDKIVLSKSSSYKPVGVGESGTPSSSTIATSINKAPTVMAGGDAIFMVGSTHTLNGSVSDDVTPVSKLNVVWKQVAGPSGVVFGNKADVKTTVVMNKPGTYRLVLSANDGALTAIDEVILTVSPKPTVVELEVEAEVVESANEVVNTSVTESSVTPIYVESPSSVLVEAEDYLMRTDVAAHKWVDAVLAGASNDRSMITTPNIGKLNKDANDSPMMSYLVNFTQAGEYYLWIRGWGDENSEGEGKSDSIHAGINGVLSPTADKIDGFTPGWNWSQSTRDDVPATIMVPSVGVHSINLWMREDGFAIDQFLLTKNALFVPEGINASGAK